MRYELNNNLDTYEAIDEDLNLDFQDNADVPMLEIIHEKYGQISILGSIELFVRDINNKKANAFIIKRHSSHGKEKLDLKERDIAKHYPLINLMLEAYDDSYIYSPEVEVFFKGCKSLGLIKQESNAWYQAVHFDADPMKMELEFPLRHAERFNLLIKEIRKLCSEYEYQDLLREHKNNVEKRLRQAALWERKLFDWRSRHLFIHITLEYKPEYCLSIRLDDIRRDFARMLANRRHNELLKGIQHYVWRLEEAGQTGLHIHWLIAYDGKHRSDMLIAKEICNYWDEQITKGKGSAKAGNFYRKKLHDIGLPDAKGQIDRSDKERRGALLQVLNYMSKATQLIKGRQSERCRTFGMTFPKIKPVFNWPICKLNRADKGFWYLGDDHEAEYDEGMGEPDISDVSDDLLAPIDRGIDNC